LTLIKVTVGFEAGYVAPCWSVGTCEGGDGRQPGHKRRDRETQDDIKAGRQLKLFMYTPLESIEDQTPSVTSVDPLPPVIPSSGRFFRTWCYP
jgi:hypothetical protein